MLFSIFIVWKKPEEVVGENNISPKRKKLRKALADLSNESYKKEAIHEYCCCRACYQNCWLVARFLDDEYVIQYVNEENIPFFKAYQIFAIKLRFSMGGTAQTRSLQADR